MTPMQFTLPVQFLTIALAGAGVAYWMRWWRKNPHGLYAIAPITWLIQALAYAIAFIMYHTDGNDIVFELIASGLILESVILLIAAAIIMISIRPQLPIKNGS